MVCFALRLGPELSAPVLTPVPARMGAPVLVLVLVRVPALVLVRVQVSIFASSPVNEDRQKRLQAHAIVVSCLPLVSSGEINASKETLVQVSTAYPGVVKGLIANGQPVDDFTFPENWLSQLFYHSDLEGKKVLTSMTLWKTFKTGSAPLLAAITKYVAMYMRL